jgi:hypothetical protein
MYMYVYIYNPYSESATGVQQQMWMHQQMQQLMMMQQQQQQMMMMQQQHPASSSYEPMKVMPLMQQTPAMQMGFGTGTALLRPTVTLRPTMPVNHFGEGGLLRPTKPATTEEPKPSSRAAPSGNINNKNSYGNKRITMNPTCSIHHQFMYDITSGWQRLNRLGYPAGTHQFFCFSVLYRSTYWK